jgi:hypothetical protein
MGEPILLLFVVGALICIASRRHGGANFAAFCGRRAHLHRLTKAWGSHFCSYLCQARSFASPRVWLLFVVGALIGIAARRHGGATFPSFCCRLICIASRRHGGTTFSAICGRRAPWHRFTKAWGSGREMTTEPSTRVPIGNACMSVSRRCV